MPNTLSRVSYGFVDAKGFYAHMRFIYSQDTAAHAVTLVQSLLLTLDAVTNCAINNGTGGELLLPVPGTLGTQHDFGSVEDKAVMTYVDEQGSIHRHKIPAPLATLFLADGMTIDPTNAAIVALNAIILNAASNPYFISTRSGTQYAEFIGGLRTRVRNQRRINIFTRAPNETIPAE